MMPNVEIPPRKRPGSDGQDGLSLSACYYCQPGRTSQAGQWFGAYPSALVMAYFYPTPARIFGYQTSVHLSFFGCIVSCTIHGRQQQPMRTRGRAGPVPPPIAALLLSTGSCWRGIPRGRRPRRDLDPVFVPLTILFKYASSLSTGIRGSLFPAFLR